MSKRAELISYTTTQMGYYIRRGNRSLDRLFMDVVGTAPERFQVELDRLEDGRQTWTRFQNACMKIARRELELEVGHQASKKTTTSKRAKRIESLLGYWA